MRQSTMHKESAPPDGFMFVNFDARIKGQGPEAPMRSIKRAYVTRQHYRKIRRQHMEAWHSSTGESSMESAAESPDTETASYRKVKAQQPTRSRRDFHHSQAPEKGTDEDLCCSRVAPNPTSMLGQDRLDPFKLFPAENVSGLVHKLFDHGECHG